MNAWAIEDAGTPCGSRGSVVYETVGPAVTGAPAVALARCDCGWTDDVFYALAPEVRPGGRLHPADEAALRDLQAHYAGTL